MRHQPRLRVSPGRSVSYSPGCDPGCSHSLRPGDQVIDEDCSSRSPDAAGLASRRLGPRWTYSDYRALDPVSEARQCGPTLSWARTKAKPTPKPKAGGPGHLSLPSPPKAGPAADDRSRLKRLMSVPAEKWHKTLQYEGGDVTEFQDLSRGQIVLSGGFGQRSAVTWCSRRAWQAH